MELKVFEEPGEEWDELSSRYTDLIFYQSVWSDVLKRGLGGQPLYFYLKEGGQIVAGLPGILLNFRLFKIFYASIPYGNVLGEKVFFPPLMELLDKEFKKRGMDQVRISESPFLESYPQRGFRSSLTKCSLLDLRQFDTGSLWDAYKGGIRRALQKARRNGLSIQGATSPEDAKRFYRLYLASMERNRTGPKYPLRWFQALYDTLVLRGKADIRFAVRGDQYAAGVMVVYSSTSVHYLHNGSDPAYLESRPNDLIIDDIIHNGLKERKAVLDFMGSDPEDINLLRFKEKWGSHSRETRTYVKDYHPLRSAFWETGKRWMASQLGGKLVQILRR